MAELAGKNSPPLYVPSSHLLTSYSGKSSFLLALLRLIEVSGSIEVDGTDLSQVPRTLVRQSCFITVPQDAFFIPDATLRFNLDPTGSLPDSSLMKALSKVCLWSHLSPLEVQIEAEIVSSSPLDSRLSSLRPLSVGQLQLLAVARAILWKYSSPAYRDYGDYATRPRPILLLDEATSSLDPETESLIYDIIEEEFVAAGHTVIIVAHRLGALAGRLRSGQDFVAWMKDGTLQKLCSYDEMVASGLAAETTELL